MKKRCFQFAATIFILLALVSYATAHCQIPCGIYADEMRVDMVSEHIATIEKSMNEIVELQKATPVNYNQLVRWIMNKEDHANHIQEIVTQYFMTQRIKPDAPAYGKQLQVLHQMLIGAMKCKQTTDLAHVSSLRALLKEFHDLYFGHSHK